MLRMKDTNKLIKNVLRALPVIQLRRQRRRDIAVSYLLGAIGVAIAGGIAAVMILSPRTRNRTLGMAREGYGKVRGQIEQLGIGERLGIARGERATTPEPYANGLGPESGGTRHANTF